ncbi:MAG: DUF1501 domain-containing protein [Pseudomonadota bacterium]
MGSLLKRRDFLLHSGALGCSLAASPLITPVAMASAPWETRLVVIILRGGMDGLDVVRPLGDPAFAALRPGITVGAPALDLDGYFALHPGLSGLMPLWQRQELGFVHAVSTPYRDKRSHFDGQDMLEAGTQSLSGGVRDGWLNRLLQQVPGVEAETAYAIGYNDLKVLEGPAPVANWSPDAKVRISPQAQRLAELVMEEDAALHAAFGEALTLAAQSAEEGNGNTSRQQVARFAAKRLRAEARIAAFSLGGWDTHRGQANQMNRVLGRLQETILTLKREMGAPVWGKTAVVAMTEFGRTARENGTRGTDHGTGGLMIMAGGAIRGGRVYGTWPGLAESALFDRRDLMPTSDVRAPAGWILRGLTGLDRAVLEDHVFPGLDLGADPGVML